MSLLIVGTRQHDRQRRAAVDPAVSCTPISGLQWVVDAYTLVLASLLMLRGLHRRPPGPPPGVPGGARVFTAASLLCSLSTSLTLLIAFRMLQAVGGSMLNPVAIVIIRNVFTDPRERAQALGVWGGDGRGLSLALGPVLGGLLVDAVGWPSIFWINVPIGLLAIFLTMRFVPESRAPKPRRLDAVGQLLVIVMFASLTYAIIEAPKAGWGSAQTLGLFILSALALGALIPYERRRPEPLLELRFFRSVPFSSASAIAVMAFAALGGFLLLNTLYLQEVRGYSALHAGLLTLPIAVCTLIFSPISGRIVGRRGPRPGLLLGGLGIAVGGALMSSVTHATTVEQLLPFYVVFGAGFGMVNPPISNTAIIGMPAAQAGVAAAIASTSRQIGQTLGVAVSGALAAGAVGVVGPHFVADAEPAWWIVAACGVGVLTLGLLSTTRRAQDTAERVSQELSAGGPGRTEAQPAGA